MLDKHLIQKTRPLANENNVVVFDNYRVTVLTNRLFRIEKDDAKIFENGATQSVWYRDTAPVNFDTDITNDCVTIKTDAVTLYLSKTGMEDSYILISGVKTPINNDGNLLGTYRTLDGCDADIKDKHRPNVAYQIEIGTGVCSKTGVAVVDDTDSLILGDDGKIKERRYEEKDIYVFAYGNAYREAVQALYLITGSTPMIPRYALGNWWSRYHAYTDKEYLHVLDDYEDAGIPVSVATIDMDWHWSNDMLTQKNVPLEWRQNKEYIGEHATENNLRAGWTGYSWNTELFPDYKGFLKEIKKRNIKITLNLHPASGIRYFEDMYEEFANAMGVDSSTKKCIPFDITDDNFINNYFKILHKPYEADGVDFWWIDWQQGTKTKTKGLDPLWALNHYHNLDNALNHQYPLVMSRFCKAGSHRYPFGFSGDTQTTWDSLNYLPKFTNRSTNIGYTWWSHDIGGHFNGYQDNELMIRYVQYGVFNPILRLHCTDAPVMTKQPLAYTNGVKQLMEEYLKFRHKFVPYIYTASYNNYKYGIPLTEPVYYREPNEKRAYLYENSYFFGGELFIAPITTKTKNGVATVKAYLPKGKWTDIFTGYEYVGGKEVTFNRYLDSIPALIKAGGFVPMAEEIENNAPINPKKICVTVANGSGNYAMYEDVENGNKFSTNFKSTYKKGKQTVIFKGVGDKDVIPNGRSIKLKFINVETGNVKVYKNGKEIDAIIKDNHNLTVLVENFEINNEYKVVVEFIEKSTTLKAISLLQHVLTKVEDVFVNKCKLFDTLKTANTIKEMKQIIKNSNCKKTTKNIALEVISYLK